VLILDAENVVSKYYRIITFSPGKRLVAVSLLATVLVIYCLVVTIPSDDVLTYFMNLSVYLVESLAIVMLLFPLKLTRVFNLRRIINFVTAILLLTLPAEVVLSRLGNIRGLGLTAASGLSLLILSAFYGMMVAVLISLAISTIAPICGSFVLSHGKVSSILAILSASLISLSIGLVALVIIERLGREKGVSPLNSLRAFMRAWLVGEQNLLENLMLNLGVTDKVKVKTIILKREEGEPIVLVFPSFHFGPFRNIGSARFPYLLEDSLEPSMKVFVFHTPCSHERNLATSSRSLEIARSVASSIASYYTQIVEYGMCKPLTLRKGEWEVFALRGPTMLATFLTNVVRGNDDLPYAVWEKTEDILNKKPWLNLVAVADTHALKGPPYEDINEFSHIIESLKNGEACNEEEFYVGYGETEGLSCPELCYNKVKVLSLRFGEDRYALVYLYGNNVDPLTREKIVTHLKNLGYRDPVVVTPDDHSCAASFKARPYYVVADCPHLCEAVVEAARKASESESRASYATIEHVFHDVELAGHNIWKLTEMIDELGKLATRAVISVIVFTNVLTALTLLSF
jgi:putative membrane protein